MYIYCEIWYSVLYFSFFQWRYYFFASFCIFKARVVLTQMKKIAIIGGGAAGLCAARHLLDPKFSSTFEPVIFEQKDCAGGTWIYEDYDVNHPKKEVVSSIYQNLRYVLQFSNSFLFPQIHYTILLAASFKRAVQRNVLLEWTSKVSYFTYRWAEIAGLLYS